MEKAPSPALRRSDTHFVTGGLAVDPFGRRGHAGSSFMNAILATALFRCWHIILFFAAWSTAVTMINKHVHDVTIPPTLLTVIGTVLGFVISYRTTSSFERYNEGRKYWSQIVYASRCFARSTWFHIPDSAPLTPEDEKAGRSQEEVSSRIMIEKKTAINLVEAFSVSVKHYLRGEEGIMYEDLYHLVKFLPAYALPAGMPQQRPDESIDEGSQSSGSISKGDATAITQRAASSSSSPRHSSDLPLPVTAKSPHTPNNNTAKMFDATAERNLLPARNPPRYALFDLFPFSLLVKALTRRGIGIKGKKAARYRAQLGRGINSTVVSHNVPHEISLYLSSYIAALVNRKTIDVATTNQLLLALNSLVDALTGLERILTTPIPFSYSIHLWVVTFIYCLALPFQVYEALGYITIPGTVIASFIFFGFLAAGEEIENPFGYDKNDLNLDHFTREIIHYELEAMTAVPAPDPAIWAFSPGNDLLFQAHHAPGSAVPRAAPEEWVKRGPDTMRDALAANHE